MLVWLPSSLLACLLDRLIGWALFIQWIEYFCEYLSIRTLCPSIFNVHTSTHFLLAVIQVLKMVLSRLDPFTPFANFHLDLHQSQAEGSPCCSWRHGSPQCLKFLPTAAKKKTLWNGWRHHGVLQTLVEHGTLELFGPFWNWRLTWLNCFRDDTCMMWLTHVEAPNDLHFFTLSSLAAFNMMFLASFSPLFCNLKHDFFMKQKANRINRRLFQFVLRSWSANAWERCFQVWRVNSGLSSGRCWKSGHGPI